MDSRTVILLAVLSWYALLSVLSFGMYWWDKRAARRGGWRIAESGLLTIDLLGGWPGGWMARRRLRHKTRKASYRVRFGAVVALHVVGWVLVGVWLAR